MALGFSERHICAFPLPLYLLLFRRFKLTFTAGVTFFLLLCCCVQRRRVLAAAHFPKPPAVPTLPLTHSARDPFSRGIQYGNHYGPPPITSAHTAAPPGSEYPPAAAADYAPPPYVKDAEGGAPLGGAYLPVRSRSYLICVGVGTDLFILIVTARRPATSRDRRRVFAAAGSTAKSTYLGAHALRLSDPSALIICPNILVCRPTLPILTAAIRFIRSAAGCRSLCVRTTVYI